MTSQSETLPYYEWYAVDHQYATRYKKQIEEISNHPNLPLLKKEDKVWIAVLPQSYQVVGIMYSRNGILIGGRSLVKGLGTWMLMQFPIGQEATVSIRNSAALNYLLKAGYRPVDKVSTSLNKAKKRRSWFLHFKKGV